MRGASRASGARIRGLSTRSGTEGRRGATGTTVSFVIVVLLLITLFFTTIGVKDLGIDFPRLLGNLFMRCGRSITAVCSLQFPQVIVSVLTKTTVTMSKILFRTMLGGPLTSPKVVNVSDKTDFTTMLVATFTPALFFFAPLFTFLNNIVTFILICDLS